MMWLNGAFVEEPTIAANDRGLLLGDGVFETILVRDGAPAFLSAHMARLAASLDALGIEKAQDEAEIQSVVVTLCKNNELATGDAAVRITVTRGCAAVRGLAPQAGAPSVLMSVAPAPVYADAPRRLMVSRYRRAEVSMNARHKTLAYLDNILAAEEARAMQVDDAIMLNGAGRVACVSIANIFFMDGAGELVTPATEEGALPGIVRGVVCDIARKAGVRVHEGSVDLAASGVYVFCVTNSLMGMRRAILSEAGRAAPQAAMAEETFVMLRKAYEARLRDDLNERRGV